MNVEERIAIPTKTVGGFSLPVYGLGTWGMGGTFQKNCDDDERCVEAIRRCLDAGVTHIDTAEMYGDGHAEELVGEAIRGRPREQLFIASKALGHHLGYDDLLAAAERSIQRMDCDYLDLYLIHHPSDDIPIEETMRGMAEAVRRGLVRNVGVCNFTVKRFEAAQAVSSEKIVCNQVHYSLGVREPEATGLLDYCQQNDVMLVAWQPIDRGIYQTAPSSEMREVCVKYNCTPVQLALCWLISQKNVVAISRTMSADHLAENLGGAQIRLEPADIESLRSAFGNRDSRSDVYPLR